MCVFANVEFKSSLNPLPASHEVTDYRRIHTLDMERILKGRGKRTWN